MIRIGHGYDAHRFASGARLVLGGVTIEFERGLAAHSDGDVLIHALCDALLGAAGLGDIGRHFPDSSPEFAGIDSRILLRRVVARIGEQGFGVMTPTRRSSRRRRGSRRISTRCARTSLPISASRRVGSTSRRRPPREWDSRGAPKGCGACGGPDRDAIVPDAGLRLRLIRPSHRPTESRGRVIPSTNALDRRLRRSESRTPDSAPPAPPFVPPNSPPAARPWHRAGCPVAGRKQGRYGPAHPATRREASDDRFERSDLARRGRCRAASHRQHRHPDHDADQAGGANELAARPRPARPHHGTHRGPGLHDFASCPGARISPAPRATGAPLRSATRSRLRRPARWW